MIRVNLYNPLTMQKRQSQARRQKILRALVILACFLLFGFGTAARLAQYWPNINTKLQLSNSCKIERHHGGVDCDRPVMAETPVTLIVTQEEEHWPIQADIKSLSLAPFARFISFRPPPTHF